MTIVDKLIALLQTPPTGTETTARLVDKAGTRADTEELFDIHDALLEAAEKASIVLDISKHDGKLEGLPFNLEFKVIHK